MKGKKQMLRDKTDIKVFILCLLDEIGQPMTYSAIVDAVLDCGCVGGFDFAECFSELAERGHILSDTPDKETYYLIADSGHAVAQELRSGLDSALQHKISVTAARHLNIATEGMVIRAHSHPGENGGYLVTVSVLNGDRGEVMSVTLTVQDAELAAKIKAHCETGRPSRIYRTLLTTLTGDIDYYL